MSSPHWLIPSSDEEITAVFLEEVEGLLENIDAHLKRLTRQPTDKKALTEIRRSFHTLKGSGRMVMALDLADMAWRVEKLLNQAIVGMIPVSESLLKLVAAVRGQIPRLVDAFKNRRSLSGNAELEALMRQADDLGAGQEPAQGTATAAAAPPTAGEEELRLKLDRYMRRADEALHRSEMALQQARRAAELSATPARANERAGSFAEVERLGERVSQLARELLDIRLEAKEAQRAASLQQVEVNHLVEQRIKARLAPVERLCGELRRDLDENRQAALAVRRSQWLALAIGGLFGGLIATGLLLAVLGLG